MSPVVEISTFVDAPPDTVWAVMSDVARWPAWTPTITSVERLDDGPLRPGSRVRLRQPRLGTAEWLVTDVVEGRRFTWESRSPGVTTTGRHEVVPEADGSRVTLSIEQAGPLRALAAALFGRLTRRYVALEVESLKVRSTQASTA